MMKTRILPVVFVLLAVSVGTCDGVSCRNDWIDFDGSCYAFVDELVTWSTANQICQVLKARLVEVTSKAENDFVASQLRARQLSSTWTGMQDFLREGRWVTSSDQQPLSYFQWQPGEPNNSNNHAEGGEDCIIIYGNGGGWDDYWCDDTHHSAVVCESDVEEEGSIIG